MTMRTPAVLKFPFRTLQGLALLASFGMLCGAGFAQTQPEAKHGPSVAWREPAATGQPGEYSGPKRCRSCHKAEFLEFEKTVHASIKFPDKPFITGCEVCHGPGKAHADAMEDASGDDQKTAAALKQFPIFSFKANPKENAERCMGCHITSKDQQEFAHTFHALNGISCNQCHSPHLVEAAENPGKVGLPYAQMAFFSVPQLPVQMRWLHNNLLKEQEPDLCFTCHRTIQAQFALPVHHRVPEGLIKCSDCHNPHGTNNPANLVKTNWETCINCHVEKRGPYIYEHPAARVEGCVSCHNPHGTVSRMLLVRREGRLLCLQCHTGFHGQPGVPHGRLGYQASGECTRCHVRIHGSNFDPNFLR